VSRASAGATRSGGAIGLLAVPLSFAAGGQAIAHDNTLAHSAAALSPTVLRSGVT
jgi:hypothetical protein